MLPTDFYRAFSDWTMRQLEEALIAAGTREEKAFFRLLLNFKLQQAQENVIGEELL